MTGEKKKRQRMRNVCFTAWNVDIEYDTEYMKYLVIGKEVCPSTGKEHLQGYCEFVKPTDFSIVKKLLGENTHLEPRVSTAARASDYCKKDNNFKEYGTIGKQGKRTDLDAVVEDICDGLSIRDVAQNNPTQYIKFHRGIEKLRALYAPTRNWVTEVIVLYGHTGCGKSRLARELCTDYWVWTPQRGMWFDGYDSHENVIMEEFRGQLPFGMMLSLTDRYECPVQVKGGTVEFCPKKIVITSPKHPEKWYLTEDEDKNDQLLRRITEIRKLGTDGTEVAGNTKPPH